jgi:polysaccharide export outer membrane protein
MSLRFFDRIGAALLPVLLCALPLAGCATAPKIGGDPALKVLDIHDLPAPDAADLTAPTQAYYVGPFDRLTVDVFGVQELSGKDVQVDASGRISFPLVGQVPVSGKTTTEIEDILAQRLGEDYLRNPQVSVGLKENQSQLLTVEGEVKKPGVYPVLGSTTLLRAMSLSGGVSDVAKLDQVVVFRTVRAQRYAALYDLKAIRRGAMPDPVLFANDVVVVGDSPSRRFFKDALTMMPLLTTPVLLMNNLTN